MADNRNNQQTRKTPEGHRTVNTDGGIYVEGDVNTSGGTFVGRDQNIRVYNLAPKEVQRLWLHPQVQSRLRLILVEIALVILWAYLLYILYSRFSIHQPVYFVLVSILFLMSGILISWLMPGIEARFTTVAINRFFTNFQFSEESLNNYLSQRLGFNLSSLKDDKDLNEESERLYSISKSPILDKMYKRHNRVYVDPYLSEESEKEDNKGIANAPKESLTMKQTFQKVCDSKQVGLIISGAVCSGKTELANAIYLKLNYSGIREEWTFMRQGLPIYLRAGTKSKLPAQQNRKNEPIWGQIRNKLEEIIQKLNQWIETEAASDEKYFPVPVLISLEQYLTKDSILSIREMAVRAIRESSTSNWADVERIFELSLLIFDGLHLLKQKEQNAFLQDLYQFMLERGNRFSFILMTRDFQDIPDGLIRNPKVRLSSILPFDFAQARKYSSKYAKAFLDREKEKRADQNSNAPGKPAKREDGNQAKVKLASRDHKTFWAAVRAAATEHPQILGLITEPFILNLILSKFYSEASDKPIIPPDRITVYHWYVNRLMDKATPVDENGKAILFSAPDREILYKYAYEGINNRDAGNVIEPREKVDADSLKIFKRLFLYSPTHTGREQYIFYNFAIQEYLAAQHLDLDPHKFDDQVLGIKMPVKKAKKAIKEIHAKPQETDKIRELIKLVRGKINGTKLSPVVVEQAQSHNQPEKEVDKEEIAGKLSRGLFVYYFSRLARGISEEQQKNSGAQESGNSTQVVELMRRAEEFCEKIFVPEHELLKEIYSLRLKKAVLDCSCLKDHTTFREQAKQRLVFKDTNQKESERKKIDVLDLMKRSIGCLPADWYIDLLEVGDLLEPSDWETLESRVKEDDVAKQLLQVLNHTYAVAMMIKFATAEDDDFRKTFEASAYEQYIRRNSFLASDMINARYNSTLSKDKDQQKRLIQLMGCAGFDQDSPIFIILKNEKGDLDILEAGLRAAMSWGEDARWITEYFLIKRISFPREMKATRLDSNLWRKEIETDSIYEKATFYPRVAKWIKKGLSSDDADIRYNAQEVLKKIIKRLLTDQVVFADEDGLSWFINEVNKDYQTYQPKALNRKIWAFADKNKMGFLKDWLEGYIRPNISLVSSMLDVLKPETKDLRLSEKAEKEWPEWTRNNFGDWISKASMSPEKTIHDKLSEINSH